ncbi:MAG: cation:proton antiporter, partial [Alphaproteobacteria bacterium]
MEYALINTIIASIVTAFVFGMVAKKLNLPSIFGYLLAGVTIGPHTPGFVADVSLAKQLAEIGIILLMFGVGLHFSLRDLFESRKIA